MIGLDTSVVVRVLTEDEPRQARPAAKVLAADAIGLTKAVLLETERVLRGAHGFTPEAINEALRRLVGLPHVDVEDRPSVVKALAWHAAGMDFADALHLASSGRAASFATFDRALGRAAEEAEALPRVDVLSR